MRLLSIVSYKMQKKCKKRNVSNARLYFSYMNWGLPWLIRVYRRLKALCVVSSDMMSQAQPMGNSVKIYINSMFICWWPPGAVQTVSSIMYLKKYIFSCEDSINFYNCPKQRCCRIIFVVAAPPIEEMILARTCMARSAVVIVENKSSLSEFCLS